MKKIAIFLNGRKNLRIGGRCGYVANLFSGISKSGLKNNFVLIENVPEKTFVERLGMLLSKFCLGSVRRKRFRKSWNISHLGIRRCILGSLSASARETLLGMERGICVCNSVAEFELVREFSEQNKLKIELGLLSHHPSVPHVEIFESFQRDFDNGLLTKAQVEAKKEEFLKIERDAFSLANFLLFPSKEAMEPYFQTWNAFPNVISGKKILFAETGIAEKACTQLDRKQIEGKYGLSGDAKFRVCYLGRHNEIKGYDILIRAAEILRDRNPEIEFCIGGNLSGIPHPSLSTWKECGYVNPAELFFVSDIFVLPNRQTYFDLVLLEALAAGMPIVASDTGGNKTVAAKTSGIFLYPPDETGKELADAICRLFELPERERLNLGKKNRAAYLSEYTEIHFAQRIFNVLKNHYDEIV